MLPQVDPAMHTAGGMLPAATVNFVRDKMNPEYYRDEDRLHTIGARLHALGMAAQHQAPLSQKAFGAFPSHAIYSPSLYLPQAVGIRLARFFSDKVYVWFYAARVSNAIVAVLLVFFALLLAPGYRLLLLIPAILPMSLDKFGSVASDAGLISISILYVALCIRFIHRDGTWLRGALSACVLLLTVGKPVYLPFALLLFAPYRRLGWWRTIRFCSSAVALAAAAYLVWSYLVWPIFALAGSDWTGHNPSAQVHFIFAHPVAFVIVLLRTLKWNYAWILSELVGLFGWGELPMPRWFYVIAFGLFALLLVYVLLYARRIGDSKLPWGILTATSTILAIALAGFVLWNPVGSLFIEGLGGRYFIPVLAILPFFFPSWDRFGKPSKAILAVVILGFFGLSVLTTLRDVKHYFFSDSKILGQDVHDLFTELSGRSCPALVKREFTSFWFSSYARGKVDFDGDFRVLIANADGIVLGESDPVLDGADFPYDLLPGASSSRWMVHFWSPNKHTTILYYWLIRGNTACRFGPALKLKPHFIPPA